MNRGGRQAALCGAQGKGFLDRGPRREDRDAAGVAAAE